MENTLHVKREKNHKSYQEFTIQVTASASKRYEQKVRLSVSTFINKSYHNLDPTFPQ